MKKLCCLLVATFWSCWLAGAVPPAVPPAARPAYFELKVYHLKTARQQVLVDSFLQHQYVPMLHAAGVATVGVFKAIGNDTAVDKRIYVFTPYASLGQWEKLNQQTTTKLLAVGGAYENAAYTSPAYNRLETNLLKAFPDMTALLVPKLATPKAERVYELRSYEGASEKIFRNKVQMFNAGGEIKLFDRLGFNGIFYGEVLFGAKMPNLLYLTSFANMPAREAHWKAFGADPEWKRLSALPEYQNNVSHIDITFLRPANYSDL
jgi:hypothetical protein